MDMQQICRHEIVTIDETASLQEAAALMRSRHVGALVVTGGDGVRPQVTGIITDRDLAIEVLARILAPSDMKVGQLASRKLVAVAETDGIAEAVAAMQQAGVRRLLVTTADERVAGLVSLDDIVEAIAGELSGVAGALRSGLAREATERHAIAATPQRPVFLPQGTPGMPWGTRIG